MSWRAGTTPPPVVHPTHRHINNGHHTWLVLGVVQRRGTSPHGLYNKAGLAIHGMKSHGGRWWQAVAGYSARLARWQAARRRWLTVVARTALLYQEWA